MSAIENNDLINMIIGKIDDLKGQDIIKLDVRGKSSITDWMVICTGTSNRHVTSVAENLIQFIKQYDIHPLGSEGKNDADWIVIDFNQVIVHILRDESRKRYELEKLWG